MHLLLSGQRHFVAFRLSAASTIRDALLQDRTPQAEQNGEEGEGKVAAEAHIRINGGHLSTTQDCW